MKNKIKFLSYILAVLLVVHKTEAQVTINGPSCVLPGAEYQYVISGVPAGSTSMQVCISGGAFAIPDSSCHNRGITSYVRVVWSGAGTGNIAITGSAGSALLNVSKSSILFGGKIDTLTQIQTANSTQIPSTIICSVSSGGSCSPIYLYQWQSSVDGLQWTNQSGAESKDFNFSSPLSITTYFRRKVTVKNSGTEKFSDVAMVLVK